MLRLREADDGSVHLWVKAVPGARRDELVGALGERLKVRISAPPEGGRANLAICALLAGELGLKPRDVRIVGGAASPEKTVAISGLSVAEVRQKLERPGAS